VTDQNPERAKPPVSEPQHPDYARVQDLITAKVDAPATLGKFDIIAALNELGDAQSISYSGVGRAVQFLQIKDPLELQQRMDEVMRIALFWTEGFLIGANFKREG
jgi:hypothetical protein